TERFADGAKDILKELAQLPQPRRLFGRLDRRQRGELDVGHVPHRLPVARGIVCRRRSRNPWTFTPHGCLLTRQVATSKRSPAPSRLRITAENSDKFAMTAQFGHR